MRLVLHQILQAHALRALAERPRVPPAHKPANEIFNFYKQMKFVKVGQVKRRGNNMDIFQDEEKIVGYVETDSGGILIADLVWDVPVAHQERVKLDLELGRAKIPVKTVRVNGKRRLIIELDEAVSYVSINETVVVNDLPEDDGAKEE